MSGGDHNQGEAPLTLDALDHMCKTAAFKNGSLHVSPALYEEIHRLADEARGPLYLEGPIRAPLGTKVVVDRTLTGRAWEVSS